MFQLLWVGQVREGSFSVEKFEENNPEGPNIRLRSVDVVEVAFRGHVEG